MKLGYSSDNRQDCTHCRFYLKDTPFQNDTAKLQLFHKPAREWTVFLFLPRHQQPCHPCAGLCGGLGSMAAAHFYLPSPIVASRHREARSDPFMIDLRKIYFQKKSISFPVTYPTTNDYKRLQSTTNVCSTA